MVRPHRDCTDMDVTEWLTIGVKLVEFVTPNVNSA